MKQDLLLLEDAFLGETFASGLVEDRFGRVRRTFQAQMTGTRWAERFTLDERFSFSDGEESRRTWQVELLGEGRYRATANDVAGTAEGQAFSGALQMLYRLKIKLGGRQVTVRMNDWMYLQPDGSLINRARMSKWGLHIGTVILQIRRPLTSAQRAVA